MPLEILNHGDRRRRGVLSDIETWLAAANDLYDPFLERVGQSPFYFHEIACAGFLASAAAVAGFIPLTEYAVVKRLKGDLRYRYDGRADLWFASPKRAYSFEMKRAWAAATPGNLRSRLADAAHEIRCIPTDEYNHAAGLLATWVRDTHREQVYRAFAEHPDVNWACRMGPPGMNGAYLYFSLPPS